MAQGKALRQSGTGKIFAYSTALARRDDMVEIGADQLSDLASTSAQERNHKQMRDAAVRDTVAAEDAQLAEAQARQAEAQANVDQTKPVQEYTATPPVVEDMVENPLVALLGQGTTPPPHALADTPPGVLPPISS